MIEAIAPGTPVYLVDCDDLIGRVTAVTIRGCGITNYEVSWWDGNTRTNAWLEPSEVRLVDDSKKLLKIGFTGFTGSTE